MNFQDIAIAFKRSWQHVFSKKKFFLVFSILLACELWRTFGYWTMHSLKDWTHFHLPFFSFFLYLTCIQCVGIILTHFYQYERYYKETPAFLDWKATVFKLSFIAIPLGLIYCLIWIVLSVFCLLKVIPIIGFIVKSLLVFIPFILMILLTILAFTHICIVFYSTPLLGMYFMPQLRHLKVLWYQFKRQTVRLLSFVLVGAIPFILASIIMSLALSLTHSFVNAESVYLSFFQEILIKIPVALCLTPTVIFFFNFSVESLAWINRTPEMQSL